MRRISLVRDRRLPSADADIAKDSKLKTASVILTISGDAMPATRVSKLIQTCKGSPSQWEGLTDDGQFIYVRYRWGCLSIAAERRWTKRWSM
jgi:hypothetical protein